MVSPRPRQAPGTTVAERGPQAGLRQPLITVVNSVPKRIQSRTILITCSSDNDEVEISKQLEQDELIVFGLGAGLTVLTLVGIIVLPRQLEAVDALYFDSGFSGAGDIVGTLLWSVSYYFCSPVQLLLLFLGRIETERPSDWLMRIGGKLLGYDVDALGYTTPVGLQISAAAVAVLWGILTAYVLEASLGDATWSVSTGIGACLAAGVYEIGRPERLTREQAIELENQWQDFKEFADNNLQATGRCHESEIFWAFRRRFGRYRTQESLQDGKIRDMVKNWNPNAKRTRTGWYKNMSLKTIQSMDD